MLNRSFLDLTLLPSLSNPLEADVRKRSTVYAFSGAREPRDIHLGTTIAVDLGALVTLARLELLEVIVTKFQIVIPHTSLGWLFRERQRAIFHQPSCVKDARLLKQLIAGGAIGVLTQGPERDANLSKDIGTDLSNLLVAARAATDAGMRTLVVRSPPIHRVNSLMGEEADLTHFRDLICSCGAVIDALKRKGMLTAAEEEYARAYLRLQERPWPSEPSIGADTQLFLDTVSISHLRASNVLTKFKTAKMKVFVTQSDDEEANSLIAFDSLTSDLLLVIERNSRRPQQGPDFGPSTGCQGSASARRPPISDPSHLRAILALSRPVDAIVVDDRYVTQFPNITANGRTTPIFCTLDLLDHLLSEGVLSISDFLNHRTVLRQSGYQLVPVTQEELRANLMSATVWAGKLVETAELKAIREALLRARMLKIVRISQELAFLHETLFSIMRLIREVWRTIPSEEEAIARADWLLELADVRGWASSTPKGNERNFAVYAYAQNILQLISGAIDADQSLRERYYRWITERVLVDVKDGHPEVFEWLVARAKEIIAAGIEDGIRGTDT